MKTLKFKDFKASIEKNYGDKVNWDTMVKMVKFKLIND